MAEKREDIKHSKNLGTVGMILQPFLIYYIIRFITVVLLTYLVTITVQKAGGAVETLFAEQKATVNAIIGGIAMLAGILPMFSDFRREVKNDNKCNYEKKKDKNNCHEINNNKVNNNVCNAGMVRTLFRILITITLAFASSIAINILFISFRLTENSASYSQVAAHQYGVFFPIGLFLYGVVSPLAEEIVFRGILYNRMKKMISAALSLVLSALLFGLYHGNTVQAAYGFLMGMLIAYTYEKCGDFLYAFLFHAAANISVYVITGSTVLYEWFITWQKGILLAGISVMLLLFLHFRDSFRGCKEK
ncbi:MAG: CPBP family intramembrane metalloprotease [Lachnospiraceae bacterium]|nr:CPBP family intramembrane metalloprotease [Lachnospiraceae bacterium]